MVAWSSVPAASLLCVLGPEMQRKHGQRMSKSPSHKAINAQVNNGDTLTGSASKLIPGAYLSGEVVRLRLYPRCCRVN